VSIRGPGSVYIDKNCSVHENVFRGLNIVTLSEEALVRIGKNSMLGGLSIRCWGQVMIGEGTMTALSLIQDVIYVSCVNDGGPSVANKLVYSKPIIIGDNVWLGGNSIILSGSRIGHDSVLSAGATCFNAEFDKYRLISGNPATRGLPIDQLLKLKART
jgi:acetyltransferase-like isoleucine patch superfamily enzyme